MSDTPKFEVIDRRKAKAAEEAQSSTTPAETPATPAPAAAEPGAGPRLVVPDATSEPTRPAPAESELPEMPPAPTAEETTQQKSAYDASAQRLEDLVRAQNPSMGAPPPVTFDSLVQQLYLSAMIQMGAGTQEGQRPRVDILGARQSIDLLGVLAEKSKGNLTEAEDRMLQTVLFDARMAFLELTNMITLQGIQAPPPPGKR
jgi:hypothetical protein